MRNIISLCVLIFSFSLFAQNSKRPVPESWTLTNPQRVAAVVLEKPDLTKLRAEDAVNDKNKSIPWRFGYDHHVNYGISNSGRWQELENGDRIWRINFISPGALSMNLIFDQFKIHVGGKVYIYNNDRSEILNIFTHQHNNPEGILGTWMVSGEHIWIEYLEPKKALGLGKLNIGNIIHGYRTLKTPDETVQRALNDSGACNVDVNCDITATSAAAHEIKENVKRSVGMIVVGGNGNCSGALINNTNNDETPYFLTANHCLGGSVAGWAFRFNWASDEADADCATFSPSVDNGFIETASGAILRASNSESDMALVEITDTAFFNNTEQDLVWAGWNRSTTAIPSLNVGIHHPSGDIQKVCVDFQGATRTNTFFNGNPTTEVWRIADWDLGVTEPGSSGSPLFDQDGLIIGKLSGGSAACSGTNDNGGFDIYGRFGVSWNFSTNPTEQLQFWLDPVGTNPVSLQQIPTLQTFNTDAAIRINDITPVVCEQDLNANIRLTNKGITNLTSATINYQVDGSNSTTINWTGNLASDEFEDIPITPVTVNDSGNLSFTATVSNPNGITDQNNINNDDTDVFVKPTTLNTQSIRVIITPDRYGAETTWTIRNSAGNLVASGGPFTTTGTNTTQPDEIADVNISLSDCYTFTINDSFGDGICCSFGSGSYRLEDDSGNIIVNGDGEFGTSAENIVNVNQSLSIDNIILDENISVYPNPFTNSFTVDNATNVNLDYTISNILGQRIKNGTITKSQNRIDLQNQNSGFYFIRITDNISRKTITKKIIKQ